MTRAAAQSSRAQAFTLRCLAADGAPSQPWPPDPLEQCLSLLGCFSPQEPVLGLGEISQRVELPRDRVERFAEMLVALGYLERRASGKFRLGRLALRIGLTAVRVDGLAEVARPWLCWMRARTGFTAGLAILDGEDLDYLAWLPSRLAGQAERAAERQARWSTVAHGRAAGLALLAYMAEEDWPARTRGWASRDLGRRGRLLGELEDVCERRFTVRRDGGGVGVAAAVLGASDVIAAVELSVFGEQARGVGLRALAGVVKEAADGIGEQLCEDGRTVA